MKTAVAPTSLAAYWSLRDSGELSRRELEVLDALQAFGPMTREQIALRTSMKESAACGRVKALLDKGLIEHHATVQNPTTKKANEVVRLVIRNQAPIQLDLLVAA